MQAKLKNKKKKKKEKKKKLIFSLRVFKEKHEETHKILNKCFSHF